MAQPVMRGGDSYNKNSKFQEAIGDNGRKALDWVGEFVPLPEHGPVVMADYGSATGRNSIDPIATGLLALRRRMPRSQPINVVHLDLSGNDFSTLFDTLAGAEGYGTGDPNVWTSAVGGSFYRQLLPDAYVTLGWCATAVHWLSRMPCELTDTFWMDHARPEERAQCAEQAATDWRNFLTARAAELLPGGRIAIMTLRRPIDPENAFGPEMERQAGLFREMVADGAMTEREWQAMALPSYQRDTDELLAPLNEEPLSARLELEAYADFKQPSPLYLQLEETGDVEAYADVLTGSARAAMEPILTSCLDAGRGDDGRAAVMDDFFRRLRASIAAEPGGNRNSETAAIVLKRL